MIDRAPHTGKHTLPCSNTKPDNHPATLPLEFFKTKQAQYVYDFNNVSFLKVDKAAFDVLSTLKNKGLSFDKVRRHLPQYSKNKLRRVHADILRAQKNGLLVPYQFLRGSLAGAVETKSLLSDNIEGLTISITTQCNLSCAYCLYGGKYQHHNQLSSDTMSWDVLKSALDFLHKHSNKSDTVRINFFGGEPLLAYRLIKRGVNYINFLKCNTGTTVISTISTNGTVLTDSILDFLIEQNIYIQFSIDGDRAAHDRNRKFKTNGQGSHDLIMQNLAKIFKKNDNYYRTHVRIKAVLTPGGLKEPEDDFFDNPLIKTVIDEDHLSFVQLQPHFDIDKDNDYFHSLHDLGMKLLKLRNLRTTQDIRRSLNIKYQALYDMTFVDFFDFQLINLIKVSNSHLIPFSKSCQIGFHDAVVMPDGNIYVCILAEKGTNYSIGNTIEGEWNFTNIERLNQLLYEHWPQCSDCYLQKTCDLCYEKVSGVPGEWHTSRVKFCLFNRRRYRLIFKYMLQLMENNPAIWLNFQMRAQEYVSERGTTQYQNA